MGAHPSAAKGKSRADARVRNPDFQLVNILIGLAASFRKTSCWPSQVKILELYEKFTGRKMSRRNLNRHLGALEDQQYIRRRQRITYDKVKGTIFRSTVYIVMWRTCQRVARHARSISLLLQDQQKISGSIHVTRTAHYLFKSLKAVVNEAVNNIVSQPRRAESSAATRRRR
jgi:hypothetical protein